jgi:general secretion pathway protein F
LADFTEKDQEIRAQVKTSLVYPMLILFVGTITIFVLLTFVIPRLTSIFEDLDAALPLPTVILLTISSFFGRFWWLILAMIALAVFYLQGVLRTPKGRLWFDAMKLKIPTLGEYITHVEIGRFARTLATLLESGVVIVSALDAVAAVLENEVLKNEVKRLSQEVANGASLNAAFQECWYFPEEAVNMIAVGEESGRLEKGLHKLADAYERQSERMTKIFTSLLEPFLILIMGSIVGFIVIAMLLPIFRMNLIIR